MRTFATRIARLTTLASVAAVLLVPAFTPAFAEGVTVGGGKPGLPPSDTIVLVTADYTLYSDGTILDANGTIVYPDGTQVDTPIATCEIQGYWFAAQQIMAVACAIMGRFRDAAT